MGAGCRSRSRSCGRHVPPSVYCRKKSCRRKRSRRRKSRRRRSCRPRRRRSRCKRSCRPGKKTNNPFLNYLRVFRKKHCGWPQCKIAIEGAKCWCKMGNHERKRFYNQACSMLKKRKSRKRRRGRCGRRKRSRRRKRGGCGRRRRRRRRSSCL